MRTISIVVLLATLCVAACADGQRKAPGSDINKKVVPIARKPTRRRVTFDAECRSLFGSGITEKRVDRYGEDLYVRVRLRRPVSSSDGYALLASAHKTYPRYREVKLSVSWMTSSLSRTIRSYDWKLGKANGAAHAVVYRFRVAGGPPGTPGAWVSDAGTLKPLQALKMTGTLELLSWVDPNIHGSGGSALRPQVLVTGATDTWVEGVAVGTVREPRFPAAQKPQ